MAILWEPLKKLFITIIVSISVLSGGGRRLHLDHGRLVLWSPQCAGRPISSSSFSSSSNEDDHHTILRVGQYWERRLPSSSPAPTLSPARAWGFYTGAATDFWYFRCGSDGDCYYGVLSPLGDDPKVVSGESGAVTLGALALISTDKRWCQRSC